MIKLQHALLCAGLLTTHSVCIANPADAAKEQEPSVLNSAGFTVASWNAEHLATQPSSGCRPRTSQEIEAMKVYATSIDADVIGLQEVDSVQAVSQLFPADKWQVVLSNRASNEPFECRGNGNESTQQKVAFAVRKGLDIQAVNSLAEFGLDSTGLRYGLEIVVDTPLGRTSIVNLHMKSGCFVDDYSQSDTEACKTYARQAVLLNQKVSSLASSNLPYIVMGDMNHRLSAPYNRMTRELTASAGQNGNGMAFPTSEILGCHARYPAPIDHIMFGNIEGNTELRATSHLYEDMAPDAMLSDHCAVSVDVTVNSLPLSRSVVWTTQSAEYRNLTKRLYADAETSLENKVGPSTVIVMDVDETVLDNSEYQAQLNRIGGNYSSDSWAAWVRSESATLVPGVDSFIRKALDKGAKLALITNRPRDLDVYTWRNLVAMGLPVSTANTCLMGRSAEDKSAMDGTNIINDKDLRRLQISEGRASCYVPGDERANLFSPLKIVMQVGDNVEDFIHVRQHDENLDDVLERHQGEYILLPNAMYGSWL